MSDNNFNFDRSALALFSADGDIDLEDLYQAIKARLIQELRIQRDGCIEHAIVDKSRTLKGSMG